MTLQIQKIQTGWKIQHVNGDRLLVTSTGSAGAMSSGYVNWAVPVDSYLSNLSAFVWFWNDAYGPSSGSRSSLISGNGSAEATASITSAGKLQIELTDGGNVSATSTYTNNSIGGDFRKFLGVEDTGTASLWSGVGTDTIVADGTGYGFGDGLGDGLFYPSSPVLVDLHPVVQAGSSGSVADSGRTVWVDNTHRVKKDVLLFQVENADLSFFEEQWSVWIAGAPLTLFLNRDDQYSYIGEDNAVNTDGFITYKLDPGTSSNVFSPVRVMEGFDQLWSITLNVIRVATSDNVYGINDTSSTRGFESL